MENEFEKYLQQNREQFEQGQPSPRVWEKLQRNLTEHQTNRHRVIRMRRISWSVAATILLGAGVLIAVIKTQSTNSNSLAGNIAAKNSKIATDRKLAAKIAMDSTERMAGVTDNDTRRSLYHYSSLIESRQKQLAVLQKVNPELYAQSQKVLIDLNMLYNRLQKQLPGSPDQQKVLKALIQNLKMQEQILNNQLQLLQELQNDTDNGKETEKI